MKKHSINFKDINLSSQELATIYEVRFSYGAPFDPSNPWAQSTSNYAKVLKHLVVKGKLQDFEQTVATIHAEYMQAVEEIGLKVNTGVKEKIAWVNWDVSKQLYYFLNEDMAGVKGNYTFGNPLAEEGIRQEIIDRHLGWEYRYEENPPYKDDEELRFFMTDPEFHSSFPFPENYAQRKAELASWVYAKMGERLRALCQPIATIPIAPISEPIKAPIMESAPQSTENSMPKVQEDAPIRWNHFVCHALYLTNTPPTIGARALAMIHTAMYNATAVYLKGKEQPTDAFLDGLKRRMDDCDQTTENQQEAFSYAAFQMITDDALYAGKLAKEFKIKIKEYFEDTLGYDASYLKEETDKPAGIGNLAARLMKEERANDCSNQAKEFVDNTGYKPVNEAFPALPESLEHWQPRIRADKAQQFLTPHWGGVTPFALEKGEQFRPPAPICEGEKGFKTQGDKVTDYSRRLTEKEKIIAEYWAGMHEDQYETYLQGADNYKHWITPPAQVCRIACKILADKKAKPRVAIAYFFAITNGLLDASIAAWDSKRHYDYVRPITLIQRLRDDEQFPAWGGPGRGVITIEGEGWQPYIPTPPFAEYVSGHSTFMASLAEMTRCFFKSGDKYIDSVTIPEGRSKIEGNCAPALPSCPITLSWTTVKEAADQAGMSRLYGGIHFKQGDMEGRKLGKKVAECVWQKVGTHLIGRVKYGAMA